MLHVSKRYLLDSLISSIGKVDLITSSDDGWFSILIVAKDGGDLVQFCGWFSGVNTIAKSVVQGTESSSSTIVSINSLLKVFILMLLGAKGVAFALPN